MRSPVPIISLFWVVFLLYWAISAVGTKKYARRGAWGIVARLAVALAIALVLLLRPVRVSLLNEQLIHLSPAAQWLGVVLCGCGMAFAIWARVHLGRNWGMPMSLKQDAELVTSGPYAHVRHPIYTGLTVAMIGTTLVQILWIVPLVLFFIYFLWSAKTEEKIMLNEFREKYADYMRRTKMLIPLVL
jgi:protein-S-isoprenylcysteine O-methyltransferase Ste14